MTKIRRAKADDAATLTELALRSKAHWGYDAAFLEACRAELTVTDERIREGQTYVCEEDACVVAFYALDVDGDTADVAFFFVAPDRIGSGVGRGLWEHLVGTARSLRTDRIRIESDPFAEGFYERMGAQRIGVAPSGSIPGRSLPLLEVGL